MATTTPNYDINYEDERFQTVSTEKDAAISDMENTYQGMIDQSDSYYQGLQQNAQNWADKQSQLQQEQTDFTIEQIEQQKDQAHKDYLKEQSGAYKDWQKQSDQYGVNAEQMASSGMTNTGFSESSQVSMYNTYQNRVATARESYNQAVLNYNNAIKDARLQNNSILAEIAHNALTKQLELSLEGFQYKNNLILEQANKKIELDNIYYNRWQDVLNQMNTENAMKFEADQAELNRQFQTKEAELDRAHDLKIKELDQTFEEKMAKVEQQYKLDYLNAQTEKEKDLIDKQHEKDMAKLAQQLENEKALLDKKLANDKAYLDYQRQTSGGSGTIGKGTGGSDIIDKPAGNSTSWTDNFWRGIEDNTTPTSKPPVTDDTASIMALGYGSISPSQLAKLISEGKVTYTVKNGKRYYQRVPQGRGSLMIR